MATFTKETSLYEILFRVRPDGSWAAQYQTLTEVKEDGVVLGTTVDNVLPLDKEDVAAFEVIEQLIGNSAAKNLVLIGNLQEKAQADAELIADLSSHLEAESAKVEELLAQIAALQPKVEAE
ncbi:hypothetical protein D3C87_1426590 [compost metagenome]